VRRHRFTVPSTFTIFYGVNNFNMADVDLTVEICGMSGDGTIAAGGILNEAMSRAGFSVLAFDSYPAEIRGFGRCVTLSRFGDEEMLALSDRTHVLISLDDKQSQSRVPLLEKGAVVLFDNRPPSYVDASSAIAAHVEPDVHLFGIPFADLAAAASGNTRGKNLAALGGFAALFRVPPDFFHGVIRKKFGAKGEKVLEANLKSFNAGYQYAQEEYKENLMQPLALSKKEEEEKILLSGNEAIARGALNAGLKLYFGYPITPATPIMEYLAKALPQRGGRVVQMEDEIASIGAVLGSFFAGQRAMTATSGPGFALMTELITHGVMSETPAVIIDAQRGGPATGLPTKTEQSDLHAAVFGGPGDSARIVIAPTNVMECYTYTVRSFQLAEKYQTPVIVLSDFFLNNRVENVKLPAVSENERANWNIYPGGESKEQYQRYKVTDSGISPRAVPGQEGFLFHATGLEHTESGTPDYSPDNHMKMTEKRHRKIRSALHDLPLPREFSHGGKLDVGVIAWGSTFGSGLEAVTRAQKQGLKVGAMKVTSIFPCHDEVIREFMSRCKEILIPELNYSGQLANLIGHLHRKDVVRLNRTPGMPMPASVILDKVKSIIGVK
jgi:2-oxoglutarate ferredoxin oxidoreductase subunit alpha